MKFDCGETWAETKARKARWRRWFAWYPVKLNVHDCRWLEVVEMREIYESDYGGGDFRTEYRECS